MKKDLRGSRGLDDAVARLSLAAGWQGAFLVLELLTAFSTLAANLLLGYFNDTQLQPLTRRPLDQSAG